MRAKKRLSTETELVVVCTVVVFGGGSTRSTLCFPNCSFTPKPDVSASPLYKTSSIVTFSRVIVFVTLPLELKQ